MPRVAKPVRPPGAPPPRRPTAPKTLGEPRHMTDRPGRWRIALRRQRRRVRPVLYGLVAVSLVIVVAVVANANSHAASLITLRQRFGAMGAVFGLRVQRVIVQGRTATPAAMLDAAIGAETGDPLLGFSVDEARARIATLASVQDATVERRWPSTILVSLTERHPFAVWQNQHRFVLIDRDGAVLADQDVAHAPALPLVVGIGAPAHAAVLLDALAGHGDVLSHLVAATRVGDRRWNLLVTSGAEVLLPEDDQDAALDRLSMLQQTHQVLDRKLTVIDLRLPDRIAIRPDVGPEVGPDVGAVAAPAPNPVPDKPVPPAPVLLKPVPRSPRQPT